MFIPAEIVYIEQHRAAGIGVVCHMNSTVCQIPNQPCVYCAEKQFSSFGSFTDTLYIVEYPFYFCCTEICVYQQSGFALYVVGEPLLL